jgi:Sporulation and spore germination
LKTTKVIFGAAALVGSLTLMNAPEASAKSYAMKLFQGSAGDLSDCTQVTAVTRTVATKPTPAIAAVELVKGLNDAEKKQGMSSVFSNDTVGIVKRVRVIKGVVYVNFTSKASSKLNNAGTSCGRDQFFAQMEKTLGQFLGVKSVLFAIDSKPADFYSLLELECPTVLGTACTGRDF